MTTPKAPADPAVESLVRGTHADPFGLLGPHVIAPARGAAGGVAIRSIHPAAERVDVVRPDTGAVTPMVRRHRLGFFEASFEGETAIFDDRLSLVRL